MLFVMLHAYKAGLAQHLPVKLLIMWRPCSANQVYAQQPEGYA